MSKYDRDFFLKRTLSRIPDKYDIRPETPMYLMAGPVAEGWVIERQNCDYTIDQFSPLTQDREHLIKDAKTYGMDPHPATYAIAEGEFDIEQTPGERFSKDAVNFYISEKLENHDESEYFYYSLICEEAGEIGNVAPGKLVPIQNIPNCKHAVLTRILTPGEETEETEVFRERYLDSFIHKKFCGNVPDFLEECDAYEGVGRSKILRCRDPEWNVDPEWVGIVFTDAEYNKPEEELVAGVQEYFHPLLGGFDKKEMMKTSGLGLAAIGQLVHVHGVEEEKIDIGLHLTFSAGSSWETMKPTIEEAIEEYLASLRAKWGEVLFTEKAKYPLQDKTEVFRSQIESILINIEGIIDSSDLKLNGKFENYICAWNAIPILGEVYPHEDSEHPEWGGCPCDCTDCPVGGEMGKCQKIQVILNGQH